MWDCVEYHQWHPGFPRKTGTVDVQGPKEVGAEIADERKKELILQVVSVVLMVVPFLAEVGFSVAAMGALARFAFIGGEVANGSLSVADVIQDPSSAPFAVVSMLVGVAGREAKAEEVFAGAPQTRRVMDVHVTSMGKIFKEIDDKVQTTLKTSCKLYILETRGVLSV